MATTARSRSESRACVGSQTTRARRVAKLTAASHDAGLPREPRLDQPDARAAVDALEQQRHLAGCRRPVARSSPACAAASSQCDHSSRASRSGSRPVGGGRAAGSRTRRDRRRESCGRCPGNPRSRSCATPRRSRSASALPRGWGCRSGSNGCRLPARRLRRDARPKRRHAQRNPRGRAGAGIRPNLRRASGSGQPGRRPAASPGIAVDLDQRGCDDPRRQWNHPTHQRSGHVQEPARSNRWLQALRQGGGARDRRSRRPSARS